jgi:hypothetical protein
MDKWYIRIQERAPYNPKVGPTTHWEAWRKFSAWPILFDTQKEAQAFMRECFTFKNLTGRKMSASVSSVRITDA